MGSRKANYELIRQPYGKTEVKAWRQYMDLKAIEKEKALAPSEKKRKSKALLTLIRAGVLKQISDSEVKKRAELMYRALPWWKRSWLRFKFTFVWLKLKLQRVVNREKNAD